MANNVKFKAPALPIPPAQYNQSLYQRTFSVLRLYFNQIDEHLRQDLGDTTINGDLTVTGGVTATTLTGTLQTAAQTNITSVGALDGGSITSNFGTINIGSSGLTAGYFTVGTDSVYAPNNVINGGLTINNFGSTDNLELVDTNPNNTNSDPRLSFYRDSSTPADNDHAGRIEFYANNDADQKTNTAGILNRILDVTDGTEDGELTFSVMQAGTPNTLLTLDPNGVTATGAFTATTLTGTLQTAAQTNITSVGALDGGSITSGFGNINVGGSSISSTGVFTIGSTSQYAPFGVINGGLTLNLGTSKTFDMVSTNTSASDAPIIQSYRDSSSPADADALGTIRYQGNNDADQKVTYAEVEAQADDVTDGTEDGAYKISRMVAGTSTVGFELNASGVDISTPLTVNTGPITINSNDTNADLVISNSEASSAEASPIIKLSRSHGSSGGNDGDEIGEIQFFGANDRGLSSGGPQQILYASLFTEIIDSSDGSEDGGLKYSRVTGGAQQTGDLVTQPLNGGVQFPAQSAAPSSPANGQVYYDTDDHKLKLYANGAWVDLN
jgi:hypothetical protein